MYQPIGLPGNPQFHLPLPLYPSHILLILRLDRVTLIISLWTANYTFPFYFHGVLFFHPFPCLFIPDSLRFRVPPNLGDSQNFSPKQFSFSLHPKVRTKRSLARPEGRAFLTILPSLFPPIAQRILSAKRSIESTVSRKRSVELTLPPSSRHRYSFDGPEIPRICEAAGIPYFSEF